LLDGFDSKLPGGTGKTFAWVKARGARGYAKIFLAGGLTPENIAGAIQAAQPFAVDACSSLESKPGKKNPARVKAFVQSAKNARMINPSVKRIMKRKARS
jgi:phosphoribosylanthranilate isomerase